MAAEPEFTLVHEEQSWLVRDAQDRTIRLTRFGTGKITLATGAGSEEEFRFIKSDPNTVLAIGRLLVAAARKAGADEA